MANFHATKPLAFHAGSTVPNWQKRNLCERLINNISHSFLANWVQSSSKQNDNNNPYVSWPIGIGGDIWGFYDCFTINTSRPLSDLTKEPFGTLSADNVGRNTGRKALCFKISFRNICRKTSYGRKTFFWQKGQLSVHHCYHHLQPAATGACSGCHDPLQKVALSAERCSFGR